MSWSFHGVGKPAALKAAIDRDLANYGPGQSRDEFEQAAPHLKGLLDAAHDGSAVHVRASGHASYEDGKKTYANIDVTVTQMGQLCE